MLHHDRQKPPLEYYPPDEWNLIEKAFRPEFAAQMESVLALGNGYLGMRGCPEARKDEGDPRLAKIFPGEVLHPRASYARDRRIVLAHGTEQTRMILACGIDHDFKSDDPHHDNTSYRENFGQVAFTVAGRRQSPVHLTKYMAYHSATSATPEAICGRADWTLDRAVGQGFAALSCIEAIIALEVGEFDKAVRYTRAAQLMDLADVGGNVRDGCHIASMGGTWMVLTYGFGGLRDYDGTLSFRPQRPPESQSSLHFPLTYRGRILDVEIGPDSTTYTMREGEELAIRHEDEVITLTRAKPAVTRPTLKP